MMEIIVNWFFLAQKGVLGVMASKWMLWNGLMRTPALHPRLRLSGGGLHLWPQTVGQSQMSVGIPKGRVNCCSPTWQCFQGRKQALMILILQMGKAKRESEMFWMETFATAARSAKMHLVSRLSTIFVALFGPWAKQRKTAFFGVSKINAQILGRKGVQVAAVHPLFAASTVRVAILKNLFRLLAALALQRSMSTRGTFKAGLERVKHESLFWQVSFSKSKS